MPIETTREPTDRHRLVLQKEKRWRRWLYRLLPRYRFSNDLYEDLIKKQLREGVCWVDLGCGRNEFIAELRRAGVTACGVDQQVHPDRFENPLSPFILAHLHELPFRDQALDLITSNMVLEHLPNPREALGEMHRVLKSGGLGIHRTPNRFHPLNLIKHLLPENLKIKLIRAVLGVSERDLFPTYYRANQLGKLRRLCRQSAFEQVKMHALEDVHTVFGFFFLLSLVYYGIVWLFGLRFLRGIFVAVVRRT